MNQFQQAGPENRFGEALRKRHAVEI